MINYFNKEYKLLSIFFLTVIILGSILVYLSINNISNYKELTEKRISEEEALIAEQFSLAFKVELESLIRTFEDYLNDGKTINIKWLKKIDSIPGIKNAILMNQDGAFLWPHFVFSSFTAKNRIKHSDYSREIKKAENHEFVTKDYESALTHYFSTLKIARNELDSVKVYNALSRVYVKMNLPDNALENYALILTEYSYCTNSSGFPYSYISIDQILRIQDSAINEKSQILVISFLDDLVNGKIPLNYSTPDLLNRVLDWSKLVSIDDKRIEIEELCKQVLDDLKMIDNYKSAIDQLTNEKSLTNGNVPIGDFNVLNPISGNPNEVLMFNKNSMNPRGFSIDLQGVFDIVNRDFKNQQLEFEYEIDLIQNTGQASVSNNELKYFSEFSSYFKEHKIQIGLKNERIVEEYVFNRKLLYGIGFILLLGVMALGMLLMVQDMSRKKQMDALRADFVSNVTHELKTPLTSILMFAESIFLKRSQSEKDVKRYANIIIKESENLQRMINNILEYSRKENDKLKYRIKDNNLSEIVKSTIEDMDYWMEMNKFKVVLEIQQNINARVNLEGIKQALSNLISNAIKYSGERKKLIVRLIKQESTALIEVEDFGIGIPEDQLELIFEKFYRVNSKENETTSGTGLGLTVTRDIVEAQKGKLLVQSIQGKGSKFTIVLNL